MKTYQCFNDSRCIISKDNPRHICRYCRFKKCLKIGLKISDIRPEVFSMLQGCDEDKFLRKLIKTRNALEFNRMTFSRNRCYSYLCSELPNMDHITSSLFDEAFVFKSFLEHTELSILLYQIFPKDKIVKYFFLTWVLLELIFVNLHKGYSDSNILYFVDGNFWKLNEDYFIKLYRTDPSLRDVEIVVNHGLKRYIKEHELTQKFRNLKVDYTDYTIFMILAITNIAISKSTNSTQAQIILRPYLNQLFKTLINSESLSLSR
uniref:Nuclear receptor domain-containing protein n=1 Tax=Acrobeloides nanus TaxID=290746 RepID=A0A914C8Y3_9BILA